MPPALSSAVWLASQTSQDRLRSSSTQCPESYRDGDEDGETETRDRDGDEDGETETRDRDGDDDGETETRDRDGDGDGDRDRQTDRDKKKGLAIEIRG